MKIVPKLFHINDKLYNSKHKTQGKLLNTINLIVFEMSDDIYSFNKLMMTNKIYKVVIQFRYYKRY